MPPEPGGSSDLELDVNYGYLARGVRAPRKAHPQVIFNSDGASMLRALREELKRSSSFTFSVAFVSARAIALLKQELAEFEGKGRIITSDYLGFNSPAAFGELLNLAHRGFDIRLHDQSAFHPKGYVFEHADHMTAIVGSSNLTAGALVSNLEWNLRVSSTHESDLTDQFGALIARQLEDSVPLTREWVDRYAEQYMAPPSRPSSPVERQLRRRFDAGIAPSIGESLVLHQSGGATPEVERIVPNAMQQEALLAIESMRRDGKQRAVVISATGTGKTILSALDVRSVAPKRMLFVVHREQILDRAIQEFQRVLGAPSEDFGKLSGGSKESDRRYVFATIQTLSRPDTLAGIAPDAFDYILVDEVHRAGASSYAKVLEHFKPAFLLGMTATPERSDGFNVFELFDFNVPYEIRLNKALESNMLAPFHYYGVTDVEFDDGTTIDELSSVSRLASTLRVDHIVDAITTYGHAGVPVRGLMFCSRKEEAHALSAALNEQVIYGHRLRTVALTGDDSIERREHVVQQLEAGLLDYILTVDIFNEGVDIPSVNQVVMLRQTQSAIVFVQQLGRGLRKAPGKDYLVVIDFIGNYSNNFLIPVALFGDDSLNRESVRQHLISAEEVGVIAGLSSVRFDRIAQERVLRSLAMTQLDSMQRLKQAVETLQNRLGRLPSLHDFLRFESADPVVLATHSGNYPALLERLTKTHTGLRPSELRALTFLSIEALAAKRVDELLILRTLLNEGEVPKERLAEALAPDSYTSPGSHVESALRVLSLEFATEMEQKKYLAGVVERGGEDKVRLASSFADSYRDSPAFRRAVDDLILTGIELVQAHYQRGAPFTPGRQYSRKDAVRLLHWPKNSSSTVYGQRIDATTRTCLIFVTLQKSSEVEASTAYEDKLLDTLTMRWYTQSRKTLASRDVAQIVGNELDLHVFVKKSDVDGAQHYYLGSPRVDKTEQSTMVGKSGAQLPVVRTRLRFEKPIDAGLFDYFEPTLSE
ncbi:DEAD/DEAH box helicase [Agrococcus sp. ARC_14]|uniref:DEAD/DEAH box helicase n=1 Tax=Agrococcus sp. ARC_14 TaxID=2919927 RepID=UPI001F0569FA|nr:DEAD/DEAH box helicase [Agrococcus sp. ARC_14]MCH1881894.1 DEAD/DEAH box helicase [Agrococcus sp. ARC_14]